MGMQHSTIVECWLVCHGCGEDSERSRSRAEVDALATEAGWEFRTWWNGLALVGRWFCPECRELQRLEEALAYASVSLEDAQAVLGSPLREWLQANPGKTVEAALEEILEGVDTAGRPVQQASLGLDGM